MMKKVFGRLLARRVVRMLLLAVLLCSALYLMLEKTLTAVILNTAHARANVIAVNAMNAAVSLSLEGGVAYEELIQVRTDAQGRVTMLSANTLRMNELAESIRIAAQQTLSDQEISVIEVPLGAAFGVPFLSAIGPRIPVQLSPVGTVSTSFATEFEQAGINQTRHKIWLDIEATVRLVLPSGAKAVAVPSQILIAESIIVGDVPQSYINVPEFDGALNFAD